MPPSHAPVQDRPSPCESEGLCERDREGGVQDRPADATEVRPALHPIATPLPGVYRLVEDPNVPLVLVLTPEEVELILRLRQEKA